MIRTKPHNYVGKQKNQTLNVVTVDLPVFYAGYLINADATDLTIDELIHCQEIEKDYGYFVSVSESVYFGRYNGIGHDMAEYTAIKINETPKTLKR